MESYRRKLIPYQVYLREDQIAKLRAMSATRSASDYVRRAIDTMNDRPMEFDEGFRLGMEKAVEIVYKSRHGQITFPGGETLGHMIVRDIKDYLKVCP
jgi:hypothetical protein